MNKLTVYSKSDCVHCVTAKNILNVNGIPYEELIIGSDITLEDFKQQNPTVQSVPALFLNGVFQGGSSVLSEVIKKMGE